MSKIFNMSDDIFDTNAFEAISQFYGDRKAERSNLPLLNHIVEGLAIMAAHAPGEAYLFDAMQAFCLHPLLQSDEQLKENHHLMRFHAPHAVLFAMEYRWRANNWLSDKVGLQGMYDYLREQPWLTLKGRPDPGTLAPVQLMLVADKVQNYKDFLTHHSDTHPRRRELTLYFNTWLKYLNIDNADFEYLKEEAAKGLEAFTCVTQHTPLTAQ